VKIENNRERFLKACGCKPVDRPPIWLMRQAGRVLPEYRALKEKYTFVQLVQNPELAAEVTIQPIRRFGFDAAVLFSDILVIPEAVGQPYRFRETGGIEMDKAIRSTADVDQLHWHGIAERLAYVDKALRLIKKELNGSTALIGFSGAPWTLANFMAEGGSSTSFERARQWMQTDRASFESFLDKLTGAVIEYLLMQIHAGAEVVQLFESLGSALDDELLEGASLRWIRQIVSAIAGKAPIILFMKRPNTAIASLASSGVQVLGLDSSVDLSQARNEVPSTIAIQGNLDPMAMLGSTQQVTDAAIAMLRRINRRPGYIVNLGHGLPPATPIENVSALVHTVRSFAWEN
jgi:uroporphyrinogen decarboxylase